MELQNNRLKELGLNPERIKLHQKRIQDALLEGVLPTVAIHDTCRLENGGILPLDWIPENQRDAATGVIAFVPSAGASSRYFKGLGSLEASLIEGNRDTAKNSLKALRDMGGDSWSVPQTVKQLIQSPDMLDQLDPEAMVRIATMIRVPKALMPCTLEGHTFLQLKLQEHAAIESLEGQVFIVPPGFKERIEDYVEEFKVDDLKAFIVEQGPDLSTLRFDQEGLPVEEQKGRFAVVPAGHGTLVHLFPRCREAFPEAKSLFIRNIDNIMGSKAEAVTISEAFLSAHTTILNLFERIRTGLADSGHRPDADLAIETLRSWSSSMPLNEEKADFLKTIKDEFRPYFEVQLKLFQMTVDSLEYLRKDSWSDKDFALALFQRPVSTMGQVPNNGQDVGGTPVFVNLDGVEQKLCIEVPHATPNDREEFLENPTKATHFNPVFAGIEISDGELYEKNSNLWIMAEKSFRDQKVFYHETVLYELLGNNILANVLFLEVPRVIFNPHKSLGDHATKGIAHWSKLKIEE